jgi:hypothetical protein
MNHRSIEIKPLRNPKYIRYAPEQIAEYHHYNEIILSPNTIL